MTSVYIHLPWCERKCPYCDFNSHAVQQGGVPEAAYLQALERDLLQEIAAREYSQPISTVFFGGGTPSLFSASAIGRILDCLDQHLGFSSSAEITLEANPGSAEAERFAAFHRAGVNRLSIGVQSFDDRHLQTLGRVHSAAQASRAFELARQAGFQSVNLDLMFALPGQSVSDGLSDLHTAIALGPEHLSWYELTLEPNTAFYHQPPVLPPEQEAVELFSEGQKLLAAHDYRQYETSAYAQAGQQCRHNLNYWRFGDYIGLGAGAHGKYSMHDGDGQLHIERLSRCRHPKAYQQDAGTSAAVTVERVSAPEQRTLEFMMNALRLTDGFELALFSQTTGLDKGVLSESLNRLQQQGLLRVEAGRVCPGERGRLFLNEMVAEFV